jgi:hypothetical protein
MNHKPFNIKNEFSAEVIKPAFLLQECLALQIIIIIIIVVVVVVVVICFTQGIHTYMPETNHVSRVYSVAAILRVLLMVHITLSTILNSSVLLH